jgi:23S rRNA (guanosine2251-2'-O)-methyltransferase
VSPPGPRRAGGRGGSGAPRGGRAVAKGGQGGRAAKPGSSKKGASKGSGGQRNQALEGRKATPPAEMRPGHPAQRRAASAARRASSRSGAAAPEERTRAGARRPPGRHSPDAPETVAGRNAVVEALRAQVPATALYVARGVDSDDRVSESIALASGRGISLLEVGRGELDRMTSGALHQGLALSVPPFDYLHPDDLLARAQEAPDPPLLVALDGVTDPRNLGAVVRSAAAFGASGVIVPERRAAGLTAAAWKASAGAAARLPIASATNLVRALKAASGAGLVVVGLAAEGEVSLDDLEVSVDPLLVVVGSEDKGLSRLVGETCDLRVRIPMSAGAESLNAGVAAAVVLAEVARRRRIEAVGLPPGARRL